MKLHHTYFGCITTRNTSPGHALRWSALTPAGKVSADTLAGCKALVRDAVRPRETSPAEPKTKVIFRMIKGECLALFPELPGTNQWWTCLNYARNGQHGHGEARVIGRPATPEDYADLKHHLETYLGPGSYKLEVVKRFTRKHAEIRKQALHILS